MGRGDPPEPYLFMLGMAESEAERDLLADSELLCLVSAAGLFPSYDDWCVIDLSYGLCNMRFAIAGGCWWIRN